MSEIAGRKVKLNKGPLLLGLALVAMAVLGLGAGAYFDYTSYVGSPEPGIKEPVLVSIDRGMSFKSITDRLADNKVVSEPRWFNIGASIKGVTTKVQAGDYTFKPGMTPLQVMDMITSGDITIVKLVVPEGYNIFRVGTKLAGLGPWSADGFIRAAESRAMAEEYGIPVGTMEGYLYPAAYNLKMSMTEEDVIKMMARKAMALKTPDRVKKAQQAGLTWHELVTLASIVQKETRVDSEMPKIASVFTNRLERGMFLQSDPTAIYGIKQMSDGITSEDLKHNHPYNTYVHKGLPPGPICNPGIKAIMASLEPEDTEYLYFVATGDGAHMFSKTYAGHRKNINLYRRNLRQKEAE